jgi:hypothetical protein
MVVGPKDEQPPRNLCQNPWLTFFGKHHQTKEFGTRSVNYSCARRSMNPYSAGY